MIAVDRMLHDIRKLGLKKYWALIERNITKPIMRIQYRKYFLIAEEKFLNE
jgi:hypothetical protein